MDDRGSVIFSVTWWYKCPALLHLPVCRYEWSVWGQMSASSSGPITERRWVEPQHLPLTSQRTCMQLSLSHTHTPLQTGEGGDIDTDGRLLDDPPHPIATRRWVSWYHFSVSSSFLPLTLAPCFPFQSLPLSLAPSLSDPLLPSSSSLILSHMIICSDS